MNDHAERWNHRYRDSITEQSAARVLVENQHLLPETGTALDLACGLGANAVVLAKQNLTVFAWDVSSVAIEKLTQISDSQKLSINAEVHDALANPPTPNSLDVILVSRFLERNLATPIMEALRPGGLLFYQTFCVEGNQNGPRNPAFLLANGELLDLFAELTVRVYREEGLLGDMNQGFRGESMLVAQKPEADP